LDNDFFEKEIKMSATMKNARRTTQSRGPAVEDLLASAEEFGAMVREGAQPEDRFVVHKLAIPDPPHYSPASVLKLRKKIGVSQGTFAAMVGVSRILVQSWERGVRKPSALARRLLQTISRNPNAWLADLK
jgi:DNA-binding transcriptional regulator YiaG